MFSIFLILVFSIQKIQRGGIFLTNWHSHFEFICFFANIIEKFLLMCSRYKKFKEAKFFTRTDWFYCWGSRYKKFKEAEFFTRTDMSFKTTNWQSHFEFIFFKISIEKLFYCWGSRYKNLKRQNFFNELKWVLKTAQKGKEKYQKLTDF